jgi:hypothetical protein
MPIVTARWVCVDADQLNRVRAARQDRFSGARIGTECQDPQHSVRRIDAAYFPEPDKCVLRR